MIAPNMDNHIPFLFSEKRHNPSLSANRDFAEEARHKVMSEDAGGMTQHLIGFCPPQAEQIGEAARGVRDIQVGHWRLSDARFRGICAHCRQSRKLQKLNIETQIRCPRQRFCSVSSKDSDQPAQVRLGRPLRGLALQSFLIRVSSDTKNTFWAGLIGLRGPSTYNISTHYPIKDNAVLDASDSLQETHLSGLLQCLSKKFWSQNVMSSCF